MSDFRSRTVRMNQDLWRGVMIISAAEDKKINDVIAEAVELLIQEKGDGVSWKMHEILKGDS